MSDTIIYEDGQEVIYDTESPILFSATAENKLGLGVTWRPWKPYILQVYFYEKLTSLNINYDSETV
jgi:hypothetical protein